MPPAERGDHQVIGRYLVARVDARGRWLSVEFALTGSAAADGILAGDPSRIFNTRFLQP